MKNLLEKYLNEVCSYIKCKDIHTDIKQELKSHIEELSEYHISNGLNENDAMEKAINAMGTSSDVGRKINEQHKPQINWLIIALTSVICLFGTAIIFICSKFDNDIISFGNYALYSIIGLAVLITTYFMEYTKLKKIPFILFGTGFIISFATIFLGNRINGTFNYFKVGSLVINISPFICLLFLISFSTLVDKYKAKGGLCILKLIIIGAITFIPFCVFPDISSLIILLISYIIILFVAISKEHFGGNKKIQTILFVSFCLLSVFAITLILLIAQPHRLQKILTFFAGGYNDPQGSGWIMVMANKVLDASNWVGHSTPLPEGSLEYILPGITSEYALLNIISHFGIIAGVSLIIVIAILIIRLFITSHKINNSFGFYIAISISSFLSIQFILNILMNFNLIPFSAISMPFVSYGGSSYIVNMFLVGIILSIWRKNNIISSDGTPVQTIRNFISVENGKLIIDFNVIKNNNIN